MKTILQSALVVALTAGAATMLAGQASAGVGVSIGIGLPGPGYGAGYAPYDDQYYYDPIYIGGAWYHGPYRWQMRNGERQFYVNGGWHRDEWRGGARPNSITFRNDGYFRGGRNYGFGDADRINARFHTNAAVRDDRRDVRSDRRDIRQDHRDLRNDRQDRRDDRQDRRDDRGH